MRITQAYLRKIQLLMLVVFLPLLIGNQVSAQQSETFLRLATVTSERIALYQANAIGEVSYSATLPASIGIESYGSTAEWLILGSRSMALAPDGTQMAFTAKNVSEAALFIYSFESKTLLYYPIPSYWLLPVWSPNSQAILLKSAFPFFGSDPMPDDFTFDVTSEILTQITYTSSIETTIQWTPDSSAILYYGSCYPLNCNRERSDIYIVNADGTNRHALTDLGNDPTIDQSFFTDVCHIVWSSVSERFYYEVGCAGLNESPNDKLYSVDLFGDNRLELDLSLLDPGLDPAHVVPLYRDIVSVFSRGTNIYLVEQAVFIGEGDQGGSVRRVVLLSTNNSAPAEVVYERRNAGFELKTSVLSGNGESIAFLDSSSVTVVSLVDNEELSHVAAQGVLCDLNWSSDTVLTYNQGGSTCNIANLATPEEAWMLDITTGVNKNITKYVNTPAWILSISTPQ
jgi:hypothetical protein